MDTPKISIVTPNYNHGCYLAELIESCLAQSYQNWELILVDDASTDNSLEVAAPYLEKYANIRLLKNETNQGAIRSVNRGLREARGDYVVMRSADDLNLPGYFETAVTLLEANPQAALFCGDIAYFRADPDIAQTESLGISEQAGYFSPEHLVKVLGNTPIHGHTVMIRRALFEQAGFFQESHRWYNDWLPYMTSAFRHGVCYSPQAFVGCRLLSESFGNRGSSQKEAQQAVITAILNDLKKQHKDLIPLFVESGAFGFFGQAFRQVIENNETLCDLFAPASLKQTARPIQLNAGINGVIHKVLNKQRFWIKKQQKHYPDYQIWIYGAGMHTSLLLRAWQDFKLPPIAGILLTEEPEASHFKDIETHSSKSVSPETVDLILVSSKSYEQEILESCKTRFPESSILTFWDKSTTELKNKIVHIIK